MTQFTLELSEDEPRPIVRMKQPFEFDAMLDTGAVFPVWIESEELLKNFGGKLVAQNQSFGGFGGMTTGNVYRLPLFQVGDLIFPDFPLIVSPYRLPCQMILSATMFDELIYEIDAQNHWLNVTVPDTVNIVRRLKIEDQNGRLHILCMHDE